MSSGAEALEDIVMDTSERAEVNLSCEKYEGVTAPKSNRKKTSFVWDYFTVSASDVRKAVCNNCGASISRGKDTRSFGTTSLASHIKFCYRFAVERDTVRTNMKRKNPACASSADEPSTPKSKREALVLAHDVETYVLPTTNKNVADVICSKRMDLVHSGFMMNVLYEQHKSGKFCDLTLISAPTIAVQPSIPHSVDGVPTTGKRGNKKVFQAHSFVLAALSAKIKTLIEMGSRTIELKDVTSFGLKLMLEIVYTGKMKRKTPLRFIESHQVWKAASDLGVKYVHDYLANELPQVAKWIAEEENQQPVPIESDFVYEITGDEQNNDLVDLCGAVEEAARSVEFVEASEEDQQAEIRPEADKSENAPQSMVEIMLSKS